jgi:glycosyltransferase involved in cell wall biosynthesis
MAAGCPVVTSNCYGTKELAEGAAVLVDPVSVESIASGIRLVLDNEPKRSELLIAGRDRSREFQWSRCARETLSVLEQVGTGRKRSRSHRSVPRPTASTH